MLCFLKYIIFLGWLFEHFLLCEYQRKVFSVATRNTCKLPFTEISVSCATYHIYLVYSDNSGRFAFLTHLQHLLPHKVMHSYLKAFELTLEHT